MTTPPIPASLLPKPRLIIFHGDVETKYEADLLGILRRTASSVAGHGLFTVLTAGDNDWTGWHIADPGAVLGMNDVLQAMGAPSHWRVLCES